MVDFRAVEWRFERSVEERSEDREAREAWMVLRRVD